MKIHPVVAKVFQVDRHDEAKYPFPSFAKAPGKQLWNFWSFKAFSNSSMRFLLLSVLLLVLMY
jgi:hypothetical protein